MAHTLLVSRIARKNLMNLVLVAAEYQLFRYQTNFFLVWTPQPVQVQEPEPEPAWSRPVWKPYQLSSEFCLFHFFIEKWRKWTLICVHVHFSQALNWAVKNPTWHKYRQLVSLELALVRLLDDNIQKMRKEWEENVLTISKAIKRLCCGNIHS